MLAQVSHRGGNWMLRKLGLEDMDRAAIVFRASFDHGLPTLAALHTPEEDRKFFREHLFTTWQVWGYFIGNDLVGIVAYREGWIYQFYVLPSSLRRGIVTALLHLVQYQSAYLMLLTF